MASADVRIEAVEQLRLDLLRYTDATRSVSDSLTIAAERIRASLAHTLGTRRAASRHATAALDSAYREEKGRQDAVEQARRNGSLVSWDQQRAVDFTRVREAVRVAEVDVERARAVQAEVERYLRDAARAVSEHARTGAEQVERASSLLRKKGQQLEEYWAGTVGISSTNQRVEAPPGPDHLATPAARRSSGNAPEGIPVGFEWVSLTDIDASDSAVHGAENFSKGYSADSLAWAHYALQDVVLPTLAAGGGIDDLRARDAAEGLAGTRSYADTYSGFLGGDSIKLEGDPHSLEVKNGYHRIWVAQQAGLTHVVAKVRR